MPKWGKPTKNRKRIDPRYFINETTNRDLKESSMEPPMSEEPPMEGGPGPPSDAEGHYEKTSDHMDASSINSVIDQVREATTLFADLYNGLPDDESKELFEEYFNANVQLYTERWQEERSEGPEDWRSTPDLPEELP